ncbi:MAG: recombination regulator RecX [Nevskiaceae bacterium]|jgi:regulatory protein|nr:recombination regulator RecX [Nevskiaceae bacterium]
MPFPRRRSARPVQRGDETGAQDASAARVAGIGLLARRDYAAQELAAALARKGFAEEVAAQAVAQLAEERLLNDDRYAENLVRALSRRGQGPARIRQALTAAGLSQDALATAFASAPDFHQLAAEVRRRRFGSSLPTQWPEKAKQMRFLQQRGFLPEQISAALESDLED